METKDDAQNCIDDKGKTPGDLVALKQVVVDRFVLGVIINLDLAFKLL
jgi:hypothetical protein